MEAELKEENRKLSSRGGAFKQSFLKTMWKGLGLTLGQQGAPEE